MNLLRILLYGVSAKNEYLLLRFCQDFFLSNAYSTAMVAVQHTPHPVPPHATHMLVVQPS